MDHLEEPESSTTTQVSHNDAIVGFSEEAGTIMEHLVKGEPSLDVISIVGMPGVGKTTLAMTLYDTPLMIARFDIRASCTVSQTYQNRALLLSIVDQVNPPEKTSKRRSVDLDDSAKNGRESISKKKLADMDDEALADHLCQSLKKRRYLIVLDDIWDTTLWIYLKRYLPQETNCSRILITTRNKDVADKIGSKVIELHKLSEASSWELFQKKMFKIKSLPNGLLEIAKRIVEDCKGLPLSIVVIAGILSGIERTEKRWKKIAESVSRRVLSDPQGNCKALLELSYNHLPDHLKPCFLYLGSFPEDEEISVHRLIIRWIGEGLVQDTNSESAEEVAKKYIEDLIVKSLVIPAKERLGGGIKTFRLHDLLRDFCLDIAKDEHFFTMLDKRNNSQRPLEDPPTRLITNGPWIDDVSFSCDSIQSVICYFDINASKIEEGIRSCDAVLFKVLDVGSMNSERFPKISRLDRLRYLALGLRNLKIPVLPSSIRKLPNLEILILKFDHPIKVPDFIWKMVKLRHVHISVEATFEVDSNIVESSSSLLENLRSLSKARVSWVDTAWDSKWLRKLSRLESLSCVFVEYDSDDGSDEDEVVNMDNSEEHISRMLSFNNHLSSLKVRNDAGWYKRFTGVCQLPISLLELTLSNFYLESNDISKIGRAVPHLKVFKIYSCSVPEKYQWNVDDDEFQELKVLKLRRLKIRRWITSKNSFPSLEELWVEKCNRLKKIPGSFEDIPMLRLISIIKCEPVLDKSAREIERQQHDQQNTEMRTRIYPRKW